MPNPNAYSTTPFLGKSQPGETGAFKGTLTRDILAFFIIFKIKSVFL
jgi:hypothetical protein